MNGIGHENLVISESRSAAVDYKGALSVISPSAQKDATRIPAPI
jgi:hypothetical protein